MMNSIQQFYQDCLLKFALMGLIRRFVMFIIKLMKAYYGRSMRRVRKTIGRKPETELPLILAVLRVLYTNDLLDSIDN